MCAIYISGNRCYSKHLKQTPFHALTSKKTHLSNLRVFGSELYLYYTDDEKKLKSIFVRYNGCSPPYLVYYSDIGKVIKRRVVEFQSAGRKNTISLDKCDDDFLMNPNVLTEPDIKEWREA